MAEFQTYLGSFKAMWAFQEKASPGFLAFVAQILPNGMSYGDFVTAAMQDVLAARSAPFSAVLTGMKQGVADLLEMTRDLPKEAVRLADESLVAAGAVSLTEMRRRVWRVVPKVLERGRIRSLDEFYVVKNVLDDDGEGLSKRDRARLDVMLFEFETRRAPVTRPSSSPGQRRKRPPRPATRGPQDAPHVPSPAGGCEACVAEWSDENSQVILNCGACGSGAVSAIGKDPGIRLRWLDPTTLEVQHSSHVKMKRNASGEVIQCGGPHRQVRVVLKPF